MTRLFRSRRACLALASSLLAAGAFGVTSLLAETREPPPSLFVRIADGAPVPKLVAHAARNAEGEWTVSMEAENFRFTEICNAATGSEAVGHVHIYEGNRKLASAFAPEKSIGRLSPGRHLLTITLQATDHRAFATRDGMITAQLAIEA
ncbi:hypothetical protein [Jiella sonneratiae]|uniref:DUF4399 domain-containing protein n=1 Tax=Jiella sonneratiae TaxID=2816856 RepID=A0ABS3J6M9_9HYPH|nr:hypothetical protein [Jiella sonneratiae]MBO0905314.1 hypothetical protein [Jiella sonneratiae]